MKYGINLLLWGANIGEGHYKLLENIKAWGFDGVEIPTFGPDEVRYKKLGAKLKDIGLQCTTCVIVQKDTNPLDASPAVRQAAVDFLKRMVDHNQTVGSTMMMGPYSSPVGHLVGCGPSDDEWKRAVEVFQKVAPYAQQAKVPMALEYLNRFEHYFITDTVTAAKFIDEVNHPNFQLHYDTFHSNIEEKNIPASIKAGGKRIVHVHISENDRSTPGEGHVRWDESFQGLADLGYNGWLMIEAFGTSLPEIAGATCIWRKMFPDEEYLAKNGLAFMKKNVAKYWK
ncbi:MAG TPA: sugar phosphate isomerase/epimerase [Tepidisphaeraceae bacterium]|nr:sugar phosphate isomerase/epimerase [Tepidisphaeraceae bacterium]